MAREPISGTPSTRVGPFSPAVSGNNLIFVSGQVALDPSSGALIDGDISTQTEQVLRSLAAVLEAAGRISVTSCALASTSPTCSPTPR